MKTIVTAGAKGADIDVLACAFAYAELLRLDGNDASPVITGALTASVTPSILAWGAKYQTRHTPDSSERFVLVDISDPDHIPAFVTLDNVSEVYDHRAGHEQYWNARLRTNAHIEMVGSCATLIWEQFKKRQKEKSISLTVARLLFAAIVSNNLAFRSPLTTDRDRQAHADLSAITDLSDDWIKKYYWEQESILLNDFERYVQADTKIFKTNRGDFAIGQIELWNADELLATRKAELKNIMTKFEPTPWIVNILNIAKGFNYVYSTSPRGKEMVEQKLNLTFDNDVAATDGLLMRKYLMNLLRE